MSFESNEDRIERLEKAVQELVGIQKEMLNQAVMPLIQTGLELAKLVILLRDDFNSLCRFLASRPIFGDAKAGQALLDVLSRHQSQFDVLMNRLNNTLEQFEKLKRDPPPPPAAPPGN